MDFKIVFIDDNLSETEPFVRSIRKSYDEATCTQVFKDPNQGLEYVLSNLNERMIVFIDWNFGANKRTGIDLLREIRKQTSLLYVVMMSVNSLANHNIPSESIIEMINEDNIFYLDRSNSNFEIVRSIINRIQRDWETKFDCVLEQWLIRHPEDNGKEAFSEANTGKRYTWADILVELRLQSPIGKSFEQKLNEYYIYQLGRSNK